MCPAVLESGLNSQKTIHDMLIDFYLKVSKDHNVILNYVTFDAIKPRTMKNPHIVFTSWNQVPLEKGHIVDTMLRELYQNIFSCHGKYLSDISFDIKKGSIELPDLFYIY